MTVVVVSVAASCGRAEGASADADRDQLQGCVAVVRALMKACLHYTRETGKHDDAVKKDHFQGYDRRVRQKRCLTSLGQRFRGSDDAIKIRNKM